MIEVIKTEDHINQVKSWYKKREIILNYDVLPSLGLIIPNVAAGYMYLTTDNKAIIEGIITNPDSGFVPRSNAVTSILNALIDLAKKTNCKCIFGLSDTTSVIKRAEKLGFVEIGSYNLLFKEC
jgi:hypothetical protein